jgi:hypothetical protein
MDAHHLLGHGLRGAHGRPDAVELKQVVAEVDDVEPAPLIDAQGAEQEVRSRALDAKAMATIVEQMIHLVDFLAENLEQLAAIHGRPGKLAGTRERRSRSATRHVSEGKHDDLEGALQHGAVAARGLAALEARLKNAAGTAADQHEVLDKILRAPVPIVVVRMQLTPPCGHIDQGARV